MTHIQAHGHAARYNNVDNAADASVGPKGPALISELRRLQKFLEQERYQEPEQFPRAGGLASRPASRTIGPANEERAAKAVDSPIDGLLDMLRPNGANRSTGRPRATKHRRLQVSQSVRTRRCYPTRGPNKKLSA